MSPRTRPASSLPAPASEAHSAPSPPPRTRTPPLKSIPPVSWSFSERDFHRDFADLRPHQAASQRTPTQPKPDSLPVAPMRRRSLMKFQLPGISLLHPHRTEMLITRRRPLILLRGLAHDRVVSDNRRAVAHHHHFDFIRRQFQQTGIAQLIDCVLPFMQLAIHAHQSKILAQRAFVERTVILLLRLDQTLLAGNQSLLQRTESLERCRSLGPTGNEAR